MSTFRKDRQPHHRFAAGGSGPEQRDPRDAEIERLQQRVRELEFNQQHGFDRYDPYDHSATESVIWDDENDDRFHNIFARQPRRQEPPPPPPVDPIRALGIRTEIPEFEGRMEPDDFIDWLQTVERIFDLRQVPENLKVKLVAIRLRKYASLWWEHVQNQRCREGKHKVETWEKMKRLMRSKFVPVNHKQDSFLEYHNFKQAALSVEEFIVKFEQLRMRCGIEEDEEQTIARLLGALRSDIADVVMLQQYWYFSDVCRLAQRVERQLAAKPKPATRFSSYKPTRLKSYTNKFGSKL
ncbi:putative retrotransposon gag domain-containing protein [Helianthus annuus]|nr:putative retrotransposon gag domain-containing protein [Helianthus annuus]